MKRPLSQHPGSADEAPGASESLERPGRVGLPATTERLLRAAHGVRNFLFVFLAVAAVLTALALGIDGVPRLYVAAKFALLCAAFAALALLVLNLCAVVAWGRRKGR